jgi:hypothetical protein
MHFRVSLLILLLHVTYCYMFRLIFAIITENQVQEKNIYENISVCPHSDV